MGNEGYRERCCCNCGHCERRSKDGFHISTYCDIDNHYIGYCECFDGWCRHWKKDHKFDGVKNRGAENMEHKDVMKAYEVWGSDPDMGCGLVFAENEHKARQYARCVRACRDERYIDIHAKRLSLLDQFAGAEPSDNLWLNEDIRMVLVRDCGWCCIEGKSNECNECCAKEYCGEWEE